jgi:hypothetical protein
MTRNETIASDDYRAIFAAAASQMDPVDPADHRVVFAAAARLYAAQIGGKPGQKPGILGEDGENAMRLLIASLTRIFKERPSTRPAPPASSTATEHSPAHGHRRLA